MRCPGQHPDRPADPLPIAHSTCPAEEEFSTFEANTTMKKLQVILFGAAMAGTHPVHALINDGKFGDPGELFVSVFDAAGQKSYYKDLGVNMTQFMAGQGCFNGDLGTDPNYAAFLGKPGLVYNIAAVNPLVKDSANNPVNITTWGYLATSSQGAQIFNAAWNSLDNAKQKIQGYIGALNVVPFENKPGQADANLSGIFGPTDLGYHGNASWSSTLGRSVAGSTEGAPDQPLEFYFVNNANGTDSGKQVAKLGAWTLSGGGQLSYSGTGTATLCAANTVENQAPTAAAGSNQTVDVGTLATLDGSGSSDPDNGPNPLAYTWTQTSGPSATLSGADAAKATFTPAEAGTYVFQLTVSDGKTASAPASVTITAKTPLPTGPYIKITSSADWKVGQKQPIAWTTQQVGPKQKVKIQFSKDGGAKFKTVRSLPNRKAGFAWKLTKARVTQQGVLKLCVKPAKKAASVCDQMNVVVQP